MLSILTYNTPNPMLLARFRYHCNHFPKPKQSLPSPVMTSSTATSDHLRSPPNPSSNPNVIKLRHIVSTNPTDGWEKSWADGVTPWDLGKATPAVAELVRKGLLPVGKALVPGCGAGYDVVALASPERFVVGLDVSETCVKKAKEWSSTLPNANQFTFLARDFFTWQPTELFDLIFDYTFFCAIDPGMRPAWAEKVRNLLKPDGELITLMYLINDEDEGPPFNNSVADYEEVLNLVGFKAISIEDNELAVGPRKGKEKLGRWKLDMKQSLL